MYLQDFGMQHREDQEKLCEAVINASNRGAHVMVTNANHESIKELYKDFGSFTELERHNLISGNVKNRGKYEELIIQC